MNSNPMKLPAAGERVFISQPYCGMYAMQVCVLPEVSTQEILDVCNRENPSGTGSGWNKVINSKAAAIEAGLAVDTAPGPCVECAGRQHKIVMCW
jgi:hypothetical protein